MTTTPTPRGIASRRWLIAAGLLAALLLAVGVAGLTASRAGIVHESADAGGVPVTVLRPTTGDPAAGLILAHGFASSSAVMDSLATAWARAGFAVAVLDFPGHGRNPERLPEQGQQRDAEPLVTALDAVGGWLVDQPYVAPGPLSLVGHSMGAGAAVAAAVADRDRAEPRYGGTVAISLPSADDIPVGDPAAPANLLLLWGSAEPDRFAEASLAGLRAGYADAIPGQRYGDFADGTARAAREVPGAEHLGIVYRGDTAQWSYDWLAAAMGLPAQKVEVPQRLLPTAAIMIGALLALVPLSAWLLGSRRPEDIAAVRPARAAAVMLAGSAAASLAAWLARPVLDFLPLAVGGYLLVWFGAGAVALALLALWSGAGRDLRLPRPGLGRTAGAAALLALWMALALIVPGRLLLSPFGLDGPRWWLLLLVTGAFLVWFAADELLVRRASRGRRAGLMVLSRTVVAAALLGSVLALDAPGLLLLVLPLLPMIFLLVGAAAWITAGRTSSVLVPAAVQALPVAVLVTASLPLVQ